MSSDSEIDDLQRFENSRMRELSDRAGLGRNQFQPEDEESDEEVLGLEEEADSEEELGQDAYYEQDDAAVQARRERTNRDQDETWGGTRDDYFGGEDGVGSEDGASEEEEQEALRLQQKELGDMAESDFVDEDDLDGWKAQADVDTLEAPVEAPAFDPSTMTAEERSELIEEKFPAVNLLAKELRNCEAWESELDANSSQPAEILEIGKTALSTYKGMILSFFALFADRLQKGDMKGLSQLDEHPVNEGLLMSRQLWLNYQGADWKAMEAAAASKSSKPLSVNASELVDSVSEEDSDGVDATAALDEDTDLSDFQDEDEQMASESEDEFSIFKPSGVAPLKSKPQTVGDFDETADTIEQQARAKNKQSLRFYTSQIDKSSVKRNESSSGDVDLPYRERDFERRQRLMAEALKRGQQKRDELGLEEESALQDRADDTGSSNSVYANMKRERQQVKEEKQQRHADALEASRQGRLAEYLAENPNVDKRAINYQIEKNKGLTRHRKKENRNARVKKRVRYDQAQKKLKGIRQVYKGSEGPYQGELTGIRKNLTHSTRFKS